MLERTDFPALWRSADEVSLNGQKQTLFYESLRFWGSIIAALGSILPVRTGHIDLSAVITFIGFVLAIFSEVSLWGHRSAEKWYAGRALAESIKTLVWRYSIGADPFQLELDEERVQKFLQERIKNILSETSELVIVDTSEPFTTPGMKSLRRESYEKRKDAYIEGRTKDQQGWYTEKAKLNQRHATNWRISLLGAEIVALVVAAMRISGGWGIDFAGFMAAVIAAAGGWVAVKQFSSLAAAYSVAAKELSVQMDRLKTVSENDWPLVVADAEEAISREHTMWLATRTGNQTGI